jgi:hypothetical protein
MNYPFLFHDPTEVIDFHFVVMQTKENLVNFFGKFLNNSFQIYSMVQLDDDIIVIIINSENELKKIIKKLKYEFDSFKKHSLFGHAYSYELCIEEIIATKITGKFKLYDKTIREISEEKQRQKQFELSKIQKLPKIIKEDATDEELQKQYENVRATHLKKWKKKELDINQKILDQYGPLQQFINLLNPNNVTQIYFFGDMILRHMLKEKILYSSYDIVTLRTNIMYVFLSIVDELQNDFIVNKFVNFKTQHNKDIIESINRIYKKNHQELLSKWNMIQNYYEDSEYDEVKQVLSKLLGIHIHHEMSNFMKGIDIPFHHFEIDELLLLLDDKAEFPIVPHRVYINRLKYELHDIMSRYFRYNHTYILKLFDKLKICFLLFTSRNDANALLYGLPIEILNLIVYDFIF